MTNVTNISAKAGSIIRTRYLITESAEAIPRSITRSTCGDRAEIAPRCAPTSIRDASEIARLTHLLLQVPLDRERVQVAECYLRDLGEGDLHGKFSARASYLSPRSRAHLGDLLHGYVDERLDVLEELRAKLERRVPATWRAVDCHVAAVYAGCHVAGCVSHSSRCRHGTTASSESCLTAWPRAIGARRLAPFDSPMKTNVAAVRSLFTAPRGRK